MADPKRVGVDQDNGLQGVAALLDMLGGQKGTSTTTSDTGALKNLLGQLQGTNYEDVLKSIFTQAGGQIPGLTAGMSNSIGARTGNNSAVSTALGKLLESTVMKAADRTAQLQQNNQQLQLGAANGIAQGTKRTDSTSGTNTGKAAQNLAILQLGSKLLNSDTGKGIVAKGKGLFDNLFSNNQSAAGVDLSSGLNANFDSSAPAQFTDAGFSFGDAGNIGFGSLADAGGASFGDFGGGDVVGDLASGAAGGGTDIPIEDLSGYFGMADGGLVGRDEKPIDYPMGGKVVGPSNAPGTPQAYADGGIVRSGGGRRSSAPEYTRATVTPNAAVQSPRAELNPSRNRQEDLTLGPLQGLESGEANPMSPSSISSIDPAQSVAVGNAVGNAVGAATMNAVIGPIGMLGLNATSSITGVTPPQSALSQAIAAIAEALGIGGSGVNPDGTSSTSPTATGTSAVADAANADTSDSGDSGDGGVGGASTSAGDSTGGNGASGDNGMANGGKITGPGSGTSDSITIKASPGEYVLPADVTQALGVRFLDELKNHFHVPAEVQNGGK